jgi:hypothetical protein
VDMTHTIVKMAMGKTRFLACIHSNKTVGIWDIYKEQKVVKFLLTTDGKVDPNNQDWSMNV